MKTIVVGYDGTRSAERALRRAAELARVFESKVVVADVAAPEPAAAIRCRQIDLSGRASCASQNCSFERCESVLEAASTVVLGRPDGQQGANPSAVDLSLPDHSDGRVVV